MNVIGIIQTDLNEFSVLFEPEQQGGQGQQNGNQQASPDQGGNEQNDQSLFLSFLEDQNFSETQGSQGNSNGNQQQNAPQELTVRIKGIPEGQKANFLQMYQILQDAKDTRELEQSLTIVQTDDQQNQGGNNGSSSKNAGNSIPGKNQQS
ncbi:hypothetical protein KDJ56_08760 [Brevibacillus composti]|uniref:Uncharacterized protein n=1 Tax=Brevibacillus composti TaxID=2796470 RepID=A0A7T5ENR2_9BACL|nr:hypothetical protein [Brevibacillus composti]QQE75994.1 hypothetical protein JD108_09080 [Brevibacillus composti]QUO43020.1 hypothetical protein KDJ56_08760 [Brevibacillus composti]